MAYGYNSQIIHVDTAASLPSPADFGIGVAQTADTGDLYNSDGVKWTSGKIKQYASTADIPTDLNGTAQADLEVFVGDGINTTKLSNDYKAAYAPMVIAGGDHFDVSQFTVVTGSPTLSIVTGPNGHKALKVVTGVGVMAQIQVNALNDTLFNGDLYIAVDAAYADGGAQINTYVSPDSYTNYCLYSYSVPNPASFSNDNRWLSSNYLVIGTEQTVAKTGTITYPFKPVSNKIAITPQAGRSATVYIYGIGVAAKRKARIAVTIDDGYASWMQLGQPLAAARKIPTTMAVIPPSVDTGYNLDRAWLTQFQSLVNSGNAVVAHGPNLNYGTGSLPSAYPNNIAGAIADMDYARKWIIQNGLYTPGCEKCYVWPQGQVQAVFGDTALLDAALAAGFNTGRGAASNPTLFLRNFDAENKYHHLFAPVIGHGWSGTTAAEVTNISNITTAISTAATQGKDIFLMLHKVAPTTTVDGSMTSLHIRVSDLTTILDAVKTQVDAGLMDAVTLPQLAISKNGNFWQSL